MIVVIEIDAKVVLSLAVVHKFKIDAVFLHSGTLCHCNRSHQSALFDFEPIILFSQLSG